MMQSLTDALQLSLPSISFIAFRRARLPISGSTINSTFHATGAWIDMRVGTRAARWTVHVAHIIGWQQGEETVCAALRHSKRSAVSLVRRAAKPGTCAGGTRAIALSGSPTSRFAARQKIFHFQVWAGEYKLP
jgi:hypothetical protein